MKTKRHGSRLLESALLVIALGGVREVLAGPTIEVAVREINGEWRTFSGTGKVKAGTPGSGTVLDGISVAIPGVKVEILPFIEEKKGARAFSTDQLTAVPSKASSASRPWSVAAQPTGIPGKSLEGFRLRVDKGSIRYRGSFVGVGVSEWAEDGDPLGSLWEAMTLESVEIEYRLVGLKEAKVEFRAAFLGSGFTPWLKAGSIAKGKGEKQPLVALEIRSGFDIRFSVYTSTRDWGPTIHEGQTGGDPNGKAAIEGVRIFGGKMSLAVRVKQSGRSWNKWCYDGDECGDIAVAQPIEAIQIAREAAE